MNKLIKSKLSELIDNNTHKLINILSCPLCKGIFRDPYTINECMHTFCKVCIYNYISTKETPDCPTCTITLGGKPMDCIIYDTNVARIVDILYKECSEIDEESKVIYLTLEGTIYSL
jgi:hypothetical protein